MLATGVLTSIIPLQILCPPAPLRLGLWIVTFPLATILLGILFRSAGESNA